MKRIGARKPPGEGALHKKHALDIPAAHARLGPPLLTPAERRTPLLQALFGQILPGHRHAGGQMGARKRQHPRLVHCVNRPIFSPRTGAHAHRCTELLGTSYSNSRGDPANTDMQQTDTEHQRQAPQAVRFRRPVRPTEPPGN